MRKSVVEPEPSFSRDIVYKFEEFNLLFPPLLVHHALTLKHVLFSKACRPRGTTVGPLVGFGFA